LERVAPGARIDRVSLADILRNSFVFPPHSIYEDLKLASFGFDASTDLGTAPRFRFPFRDDTPHTDRLASGPEALATYHRLLCEAIARDCRDMAQPWLLQSGGKDSTSLAIALADVRPDTACLTYLGGHEENELDSATQIAARLGLRHEHLVCDPSRAYDRYLAIVARMPLLTADFALLSYVDLATEIADLGGDGIIDGLGSDLYFGMPLSPRARVCNWLARDVPLPPRVAELPLIEQSFHACFGLATLQMNEHERQFPGSRFTDAEVDALMGDDVARQSKQRLALFLDELAAMPNAEKRHCLLMCLSEPGAYGKGQYPTHALSLPIAYPFCDEALRDWVHRRLHPAQRIDPVTGNNKALVREHIAARFGPLPYVARKGCFRFDLSGLARARFDQVHAYARDAQAWLPGAARWLERNRKRMGNKYHASKFYLLAVALPWLLTHETATDPAASMWS